MKILYIANERRSAELAVTALCNIAPELVITWAGHLPVAMRWVHDNLDLVALVVEAEVQNQNCTSFVSQVRSLGLTAPVIVVTSEEVGAPLAALRAGADDYVARQSLPADLPDIVSRAVERAQATAHLGRQPMRLLYIGDAALARECLALHSSIEITEAVTGSDSTFQPIPSEFPAAGLPLPFDILLVEHDHPGVDTFAILKHIAARRLHVPVIFVAGRDDELAVPALNLGATDYVVKTKNSFRALFYRLERGRAHSARVKGQADLHVAPAFLQSGVDKLPCLMRLAQDGRILDLNTAGLAAFGGATRRAVVGSSIYAYLSEEHRDAMRSMTRNARSDAASTNVEFEMVAPEGGGRCILKARTTQLTHGEGGSSILCVFDDVTEPRARELQSGERESEPHCLEKTARAERQVLEEQLVSARAHIGRVKREYAAARQDWEKAREHLQTAVAAAAAVSRERLRRQVRDARASASETERRFNTAVELLREGKTLFRAVIDQERAKRDVVAQDLADAQAALEEAERRHAAQMTTAAAQLAERHAEYDAGLAQSAAARETLAQRVREAEGALERAQQDWAADTAAAADRLTRREAELAATLAEATATQHTLELRLVDTETALQHVEERASIEQRAAAQASQRREEVEVRLAQEVANRDVVAQDLADAQAALEEAERRHASQMATAAAQLAERHAEYDAGLAQSAAARETLAQRVREAEGALERAQQDWAADTAAAADRLTRREAELAATLAEATATQHTLELRLVDTETALQHVEERASIEQRAAAQASQRREEVEVRLAQEVANRDVVAQDLADAQAALEEAERRHASQMTTAAAQLAERQAEYDAGLAQSAAARETLAQRVREAEGALERAQQDWAADTVAAADRLTRREAELAATLAEATATQHTLELRLVDTETALQHVEERASIEQRAAAQASQRREEVEVRLAQEVANRDVVAQNLAGAQAALEEAERRHASQMATAAAQLAERHAEYDAGLAQSAAARETLAQRVREAEGALERAQQDWAADTAAAADRLTRREAELAATLAEATATQHTLELRLVDTETALQHVEERASIEQRAAAQASQRREEVEVRLAQEVANRENLERDLANTRVASEQVQRCFLDEAAAVSQRTREHEALLEERFARERVDQESIRAEMQEEIRRLQLERDTLHESLDTSQEQLQRLKSASNEARENLERVRMTSEAELQRLAADYADVQQTLEQVRTDLEQTLERASSEHAAERTKLETLVIERDTQLKEQAARHSASQHAAANAINQIEDGLSLALVTRSRDRREIEQLQRALETRGQELEASRSDREVLRTEADRVPQLQNQLDDSQAENRRQFQQNPFGICRCGRDGALTHVNHALVALLGYRTSDELRTVDFGTKVFESGDDLRLLIERCLSKGTLESVETTWRRKDSGRLVVRLLALPAASESIEIVVEDITRLRGLEERLRQVQPMEAVGRLATEVAGTCDNVLRDVSQDAQQWLATIDGDTALRHEGERLLHEVTRAAGFLRQLTVYSRKQATAFEPIDVNRLLRDLEPVLRRVAGADIELVLPKTSTPVNVDVEAERVERVLVNVASYGRERMPFGGRLLIELATVVVGSEFVAKYPNVRPGDHVLITVTEVRDGLRSEVAIGPRKAPAGANTMRSVPDRPGVDLGVLQGLIRDCGGHLWIKAEPTGDMVLKMRLPQPVLNGPAKLPTGGPRSDRGRSMARWFRH